MIVWREPPCTWLVSALDHSFEKEKNMARKLLLALGVAAFSLAASACNTVKGLGEDVESVGEAGDEAI
jgi:predicted small secreted protein